MFGNWGGLILQIVVTIVVVLGLIAGVYWLVRRYSAGGLGRIGRGRVAVQLLDTAQSVSRVWRFSSDLHCADCDIPTCWMLPTSPRIPMNPVTPLCPTASRFANCITLHSTTSSLRSVPTIESKFDLRSWPKSMDRCWSLAFRTSMASSFSFPIVQINARIRIA